MCRTAGTITGATSNILSIAPVLMSDVGNYSVVVTNTAGKITNSASAALAVSLPPSVSLASGAGGTVVLSATTVPGLSYVVQAASNLNPPIAWSPLVTNAASAGGALQFTNSALSPLQFFRVLFP